VKGSAKPSSRPQLPKVSDEMKAWSAALADEMASWPGVSSRPMFGFSAYYRGDKIFCVLPRTRGMETPNSLAFKLESMRPAALGQAKRDPRIHKADFAKGTWFGFEILSEADLRDVLNWLLRAHEAAC
jgi:hypothetical protein